MRKESDFLGEVEVPADAPWGAQTHRALHHFAIGDDTFPEDFLVNYVCLKRAAARANVRCGVLDEAIGHLIVGAANDLLVARSWDAFPLSPYQSGSGTQLNMNVNEVIARRAAHASHRGAELVVHPNDHVNCSQSTNDTFPTVMHMTTLRRVEGSVVPAVIALADALQAKSKEASGVVKLGRTHMMDAVPMFVGSEIAAWADQCRDTAKALTECTRALKRVPLGATAVGTGLNAPENFAMRVLESLREEDGIDLELMDIPFTGLANHDPMVRASSALKDAAVALHAIASNVRLLASGPRGGIAELELPANEPGSSIMPGKCNPTQCEALTMACARVIGNDTTVTFAGAQGHLQLNVYKPVIACTTLESTRLLADAVNSFRTYCVAGMRINATQAQLHLDRSHAVITALAPTIGYSLAAAVVREALDAKRSLKEVALEFTDLSAEDYDRLVDLTTIAKGNQTKR